MIRLTAWVAGAPGPIVKTFDSVPRAEAFRAALGARLRAAIRERITEDAHFASIWLERFGQQEADYYSPDRRSIASLSCRALVPDARLYNERYGTYDNPMGGKKCSTPNGTKRAA
jgi:hypothetical protein